MHSYIASYLHDCVFSLYSSTTDENSNILNSDQTVKVLSYVQACYKIPNKLGSYIKRTTLAKQVDILVYSSVYNILRT